MVFGKGQGKYLIMEEALIGGWRMTHKKKLHCLYSSLVLSGRLDKQHEVERTKPRMGETTAIHTQFCSIYLKRRTNLETQKSKRG
jgi:hypothetical protein